MWLFTKTGHFSIGEDSFEPNRLIFKSQHREDLEYVLTMLDAICDQHVIEESVDGDYKFLITAQRRVAALAVARIVTLIDYGKMMHSVHFDFGNQPDFLLWLTRSGIQVARPRPE